MLQDEKPLQGNCAQELNGLQDEKQLLGKRVLQLRQERAMSQEEFSEVTEISSRLICLIERGEANPRFETLHKIASAAK